MRIPISQFDRCNSSGNMFLWGIHLEFQPKAMDGNDLDRKSSRLPHSVSIFPGRPTNLNQRLLKSKADWVRLFYHENTSLPTGREENYEEYQPPPSVLLHCPA